MNAEQRRAEAVRYYREVKSAAKAAKRYHVSQQTIYNWAKNEKNNPALEALRASIGNEISQDAEKAIEMGDMRMHAEVLRLEADNLRLNERLSAMTRLLSSFLNS